MLGGGNSKMIIYKVFCKNYELKQGELMGALAERRKGLRGKTRVESGLRWARLVFGQMGRDKQAIFVVPYEVNLKENIIMPVEKMVFTREEFSGMMRRLDQRLRRKGGEVHNTIFS
jgi:hypothetical protein